MGYTHGKMWNQEKILSSLTEVMKSLNIDRMPSVSEIEKYYGDSCLTNKIGKTGGMYRYAELLGLEVKESETALGVAMENRIKQKLIDYGFDAERTSTRAPYDILVNGRVKIDVKASRLVTSSSSPYYTFNLEKKHHTCDFYIAVTLNKGDTIRDIFIIPSNVMAGKTQLSIGVNKTAYSKYIDRWDLIETLDEAFKGLACE